MPSSLLVPLIGLGGTFVTTGANMLMQHWANERNEKLALEQYRRQRQDIAAMNAYNSPAAQVVRLRAAGLSPAMFYNGSSAVAGEQSSVPTYDRPTVQAPQFDTRSVVGAFTDLSRVSQEAENSKYENELKKVKVQQLLQQIEFDTENNPILLDKARQELEDARLNHQKLEEEYKQAVAGTTLANLNIEKLKAENSQLAFNLMKAITLFPRELRAMDTAEAIAWIKVHQDDQRLQIALATLNETIRHNQESENFMWYNDAQDRAEHKTDLVTKHTEWWHTLNTQIKMFNVKQNSGIASFIEGLINSYLEWNQP